MEHWMRMAPLVPVVLAGVLGSAPAAAAQDLACPFGRPVQELTARPSPPDSATIDLDGETVKVCYSGPSARGRTMIGGSHVPFGRFWRTGANEATVLIVTSDVMVGGVELEPGSYSLYTRPGESEWEVFVNRTVQRWGIPIDDGVRSDDIGSAVVPVEDVEDHVETFTIRFEETGAGSADMVLEWEHTRTRIPVTQLSN